MTFTVDIQKNIGHVCTILMYCQGDT